MTEVHEKLMKILSDVLWRNSPEPTYSEQEWEDILSTAEEQGVLFLVLQGCTSIRQQFSAAGWLKWRSKMISTMINNELLMEAQNKIVDLLKEGGIPYAVLKGTSLSACYYNPAARALGDIDLLVPVQFVDRASEILVSQGFHAPEDSFAHPYHIDFYKDSIVVELHYAVSTFPDSSVGTEAKRYMESWQEQLQQKHIGNYTFQCFSDSHQALSLLLHMERHMTTGCIGLRQLCDWAAFLTSVMPEYFEDQILPELKLCGLKKFAGVLTRTAIRYLGLNSAYGMLFQSVRECDIQAMMEEILRAGSIHNKNNTKEGSNFFVDESGTASAVQVFVARTNSLARRKFPVTKKAPFLLPLFWLYLPLRYWIRSLMGKRRPKSLLRTITVTKQRKQLYRTLKLFKGVQEK
nr:nucleotidyltransferase family protein [uncultured Blautia sp.]